jgi:hypothetical protein
MKEILTETQEVMHEFIEQTNRMVQGEIVSPLEINNTGRKMINCHWEVSLQLATKFSAKEKSYLDRKIKQAKSYKKGRYDDKLKSAKDAENQSIIATTKELYAEVDRAEEYETLRQIQRSLERAIDQNRSTQSLMKLHETNA